MMHSINESTGTEGKSSVCEIKIKGYLSHKICNIQKKTMKQGLCERHTNRDRQ